MSKLFYFCLFLLSVQISYPQDTHTIQVRINQESPRTLGVENTANVIKIAVYPNPAADHLIIELGTTSATIKLIDLSGREVLVRKANGGALNLNLQGMSKGMYLVQIQLLDGFYSDKILIK